MAKYLIVLTEEGLMTRQVSTTEWKEGLETIRMALEQCGDYHEQFMNDVVAQREHMVMTMLIDNALTLAGRIRDREDVWADAAEGIERADEAELRRQEREEAGV